MEAFSLLNMLGPLNETDRIKGFATAEEMQQFYLDNYEETWAGVS